MRRFRFLSFFLLVVCAVSAVAQTQPDWPYYSRRNSFGVLTAYSNDSSHMLLGVTENRRLLEFGGSYSRRLLQNRLMIWQYDAEILPVALESDPVDRQTQQFTLPTPGPVFTNTFATTGACHSSSGTESFTINGIYYSFNYANSCSRRWTIGEGMSPVGFRLNFRPRHRWQPFVDSHGGYMYSTHPIPTDGAGSFNFTFDLGAGVEFYRSKTQSVRAEYRYHHISNDNTAGQNPGIDSGIVQLTYAFGR